MLWEQGLQTPSQHNVFYTWGRCAVYVWPLQNKLVWYFTCSRCKGAGTALLHSKSRLVFTPLWLSRASICPGRNRNPRGGDHYPIYWVTMIHLAFRFHQIEQLKLNLFPSCCDFSFLLVYPNFYFLRQESKTGCLFIYWRYIWRKLQRHLEKPA